MCVYINIQKTILESPRTWMHTVPACSKHHYLIGQIVETLLGLPPDSLLLLKTRIDLDIGRCMLLARAQSGHIGVLRQRHLRQKTK